MSVDLFLFRISATMAHTKRVQKEARSKYLIAKSRVAFTTKAAGPMSSLCHIAQPVLTRIPGLSTVQQCALLRARFFYCFPPTDNCLYCDIPEPHTVTHALWTCTFTTLAQRRQTMCTMTRNTLHLILDGREDPQATNPTLHLCNALAMLSWSPHYYPRA